MEEIKFCSIDIDQMKADSKKLVETFLDRKLSESDPLILFLYSLLSIICQQRELINLAANQNLLRYATDENLNALAELVGVSRLPASFAFCTMEVTLSAPRTKETVIRAGTRITTANNIHFALDTDIIFLAGETTKTAHATCLETGSIGNDFRIGEINQIVDYQAYLKSISNITVSEGGADIEEDNSLRERVRLAPSSFSVAGSRQAYIFHAKEASKLITDVYPMSPVPGRVEVYILTEDGVPGEEILQLVQEYLSDEKIRPLTDNVFVKPAEIISYDIDVKFWISRADSTQALSIKTAAESAVDEYILWQAKKLGRDINSTELIWRLRSAGVKRAEIVSPVFTVTPPNAVAIVNNVNIEYKGLEDE